MGPGSGKRAGGLVMSAICAAADRDRNPCHVIDLARIARTGRPRLALTLRLIPVFYHGHRVAPENTSADWRRSSPLLRARCILGLAEAWRSRAAVSSFSILARSSGDMVASSRPAANRSPADRQPASLGLGRRHRYARANGMSAIWLEQPERTSALSPEHASSTDQGDSLPAPIHQLYLSGDPFLGSFCRSPDGCHLKQFGLTMNLFS